MELSLSQCHCFLPTQPLTLKPLRGLFATKKNSVSSFYSFQLPLFLLLVLHMQTHTRAEQDPPSRGISGAAAAETLFPSRHRCVWGQQEICENEARVKIRGCFLLLLRVWEFWVVSQRNKCGVTAHPPLLPCDSIGSIASRSKSCLLFLALCLVLHCLVLAAFFKNVLKYSVMHHNIYSEESPDCINYYRWYETTAGLAIDCRSNASAFLSQFRVI